MADALYEGVELEVEFEERKGRDRKYKVPVVKYKDKTWTVGKKDQDKVKAGQRIKVDLSKSEYNDKIYYWANCVDEGSNESGQDSRSQQKVSNTQVVEYFKSLDKKKRISMLQYLLGLIDGE